MHLEMVILILIIHLNTFCWSTDVVGVVFGPGEGLNSPPLNFALSDFFNLERVYRSSECLG